MWEAASRLIWMFRSTMSTRTERRGPSFCERVGQFAGISFFVYMRVPHLFRVVCEKGGHICSLHPRTVDLRISSTLKRFPQISTANSLFLVTCNLDRGYRKRRLEPCAKLSAKIRLPLFSPDPQSLKPGANVSTYLSIFSSKFFRWNILQSKPEISPQRKLNEFNILRRSVERIASARKTCNCFDQNILRIKSLESIFCGLSSISRTHNLNRMKILQIPATKKILRVLSTTARRPRFAHLLRPMGQCNLCPQPSTR